MSLTLDTTNISTEGAVKYIANDAACTEWVAGSSWLEYQWACEPGNNKKYRCLVPSKCSSFPPTSDYVDGDTAVWNKDEVANAEVTAWGETLTLDAVAMGSPANPAARDVNDSAPWKDGKPYYEGELVIETGMMFECLDITQCGTVRPTSTSNADSSIWA